MKALVYTKPFEVEYRDVADPVASEGEAIVRVDAVGICGSDMHAYAGHDERRPAPLILGHEAAGIVETGKLAGKRVTINPLVTCGECVACQQGRDNLCPQRQIISMPPREGAFAEKVAMPEENLIEVPDDIPLQKAALAEPIACGWHAVRLAQNVLYQPLDEVFAVVLGGGAIGVGAALVLIAQGCRKVMVVEPNADRRSFIQKMGGFEAVESADMIAEAPQLMIDAVGFESSRETASKIIEPGGVIMHIGLGSADGGLDIRRMTLQEITFIGTYTYTMQDFKDTAQAIFSGSLGTLDWADIRHLSEGAKALDDMKNGRVSSPKIILTNERSSHD